MASVSTTIVAPHRSVISALTTFYSLLVDPRCFPASAVSHPSASNGRHPAGSINRRSAMRNGFSDAAVELAYQIPYVIQEDYKLTYETTSLCYLRSVEEENAQGEVDKNVQEEGEDA